ncbi:hypothetical protein HKK55_15660 [Pseudomonas sp. ADAK18]|uniref:DUF6932 family protein n=1 Tax=Pseudomonas sp. ADAK18 TaxID=2730848 RepID=UPI001463E40E|nr:hypothetical protein [Pseudomonas sp. ADAK18]QJI30074.1 hypothetical protein HKK55_15660 [Pseudomonas sp. ADAK18]
MISSELDSLFSQYYNRAKSVDFPAFLGDKTTCTPFNATPYITHLSTFLQEHVEHTRRLFATRLNAAIMALDEAGICVEIVLVGGSFLDSKVIPGDLDCVLFYSLKNEQTTLDLQQWQLQRKGEGLDARLIPMDTSPLLTLKAALFFAVLYTQRKNLEGIPTGLILIDCKR